MSIRINGSAFRTRLARAAAAILLALLASGGSAADATTSSDLVLPVASTTEEKVLPEGETPEKEASEGDTAADPEASTQEPLSTTRHRIDVQGEALSYTATAGRLPLRLDGVHKANVFFVSYRRDDSAIALAERPITFVFNGGPGAASAYLHLGALGPHRLVVGEDGVIPPAPARLTDNDETWLTFTDLVFVDPVGTGYSRRANGSSGARSPFWETREDLRSLAEFIRLYLTLNNRRLSPVFLAGESYGGFRVARLADTLTTEVGVGLNGVVLISPVLEFSLMYGDSYSLLPWVLLLPAYAATALAHDRADFGAGSEDLGERLEPVESFALNQYLRGLAEGDRLGGEARTALYQRIARYTGLPADLVARHRGRVPREVFARHVLANESRTVSLYDGAIAGIDPRPESGWRMGHDPVLQGLTAPLSSTLVAYLRDHLGYQSDLAYELLNPSVFQGWQWRRNDRSQGYLGAADELKAAMSLNRHLKAWIVHGYHDLVTSYFASQYVVDQMALDPEIRANLTVATYDGGHMFYTRSEARMQFAQDAREFYRNALQLPAGEAEAREPEPTFKDGEATEKHQQRMAPAADKVSPRPGTAPP